MNPTLLVMILLPSCAGIGSTVKNVAESFVEKESREAIGPDLLAMREMMKATSFRLDLLTSKLSTVADHFSTTNNNMKDLYQEVNKYIIANEKKHLTIHKRVGLIEEKLKAKNDKRRVP